MITSLNAMNTAIGASRVVYRTLHNKRANSQNGVKMFRVIIAGGRDFYDYGFLREKCDFLFQNKKPTLIVCGEAKGADTLGKWYAAERGIPCASYPAEWDAYGKQAGYLRNVEMAKNADALVAFWNGQSRGTRHMIEIAQQYGLLIRVIRY